MYMYKGFFGELELELMALVSGQISDKMKLEYSTLRSYSQKYTEIERELIEKGINFYAFYESCTFLRDPTKEDSAFVKTLSDYYLLKLLVVVGKGLRAYVDAYEEKNLHCEILHKYYLLLKREIKLRPNLGNVPSGDGFKDYLSSREDRNKLTKKKENARIKGNICIHCESTNIRSNGSMWYCIDCKRSFRKHLNN